VDEGYSEFQVCGALAFLLPSVVKKKKNSLSFSFSGVPLLKFRIAAIRETFEESGVLVAKPEEALVKVPPAELTKWRTLVSGDASHFIKMCKLLSIYPDVHRLHEWSNWVTPAFEAKRFDTKFFLAILDRQPHAMHDNKEATTTDWVTPQEVVQKNRTKEIKVMPPQFYTMFELQAVRSLEALATEAKNKIVNPIQPEFNPAENGEVLIAFPGDPLHPGGAAKPTDKHRLLAQMDGVHMIMRLEKNIGIPSIIAGKL